MMKTLFRLVASSAGFVAVLLVAQVAIATPQIDSFPLANGHLRDLNVSSPTLNLTSQSDRLLLDHLGCSCAACTQSISQIDTI